MRINYKSPFLFLSAVALLSLSSCGPKIDDSFGSEISSISNSSGNSDSGDSSLSEVPSTSDPSISGDSVSSGETSVDTYIVPTIVNIFYKSDTEDYNKEIYVWAGGTSKYYPCTTLVDFGCQVTVDLADFEFPTEDIQFIIRPKGTWAGQSTDTRVYFPSYNDYIVDDGTNKTLNVYAIDGEGGNIECYQLLADASGDKIVSAKLKGDELWKTIEVTTTAAPSSVQVYKNDTFLMDASSNGASFNILLSNEFDLSANYQVRCTFPSKPEKVIKKTIATTTIYDTNKFISTYTYDGDDLGVNYTKTKSTFKVWAPTSSDVKLYLYTVGVIYGDAWDTNTAVNNMHSTYQMEALGKGVWGLTIEKDLEGKFYTYLVTNSSGVKEVCDPYARAAGLNGNRAAIVDFSKTNPEGWDSLPTKWDKVSGYDINSPVDLITYEAHVRDLTNSSTWKIDDDLSTKDVNESSLTEKYRTTYKGLIYKGTTYTEGGVTVKTGFDHLEELGVNAIQLLPVFDQDNVERYYRTPANGGTSLGGYNWGYNPKNYTVVEGAYSTNPINPKTRITEFKEMVQAFANNANKTRIIMDVVYNHTSSVSSSNLTGLVPGYFYRTNQAGFYTNGSGCGNETNTGRIMMERLMISSVKFWASEYKVKGFRFDLMQLINKTAMKHLAAELKTIDPDIVIYGEPWSGDGQYDAGYSESTELKDTIVSQFNDVGRNALKGGTNPHGSDGGYGWIQKGEEDNKTQCDNYVNNVKGMMSGSRDNYYATGNKVSTNPSKQVNYADCHDNYTVYDQMQITLGVNSPLAAQASTLATATVMFSQGMPFFQGGAEIMRSKEMSESQAQKFSSYSSEFFEKDGVYFCGNSYNVDADVNEFDYARKITYKEYFDDYVGMIALRKARSEFHMSSASQVSTKFGYWENTVGLSYCAIAAWNTVGSSPIYIFINARNEKQTISWGSGTCSVLFNTASGEQSYTDSITLSQFQCVILLRN